MSESVKLVDSSWKENFGRSRRCCCQFSSETLWVLLACLEASFFFNHNRKAESAAHWGSSIQCSLIQASCNPETPWCWNPALGSQPWLFQLSIIYYISAQWRRGCGVKCALQRAQEANYLRLVNFYSLKTLTVCCWLLCKAPVRGLSKTFVVLKPTKINTAFATGISPATSLQLSVYPLSVLCWIPYWDSAPPRLCKHRHYTGLDFMVPSSFPGI